MSLQPKRSSDCTAMRMRPRRVSTPCRPCPALPYHSLPYLAVRHYDAAIPFGGASRRKRPRLWGGKQSVLDGATSTDVISRFTHAGCRYA